MDERLKTYIVEDNVTIRENLVGTLEELAHIATIGFAESENEAVQWLQSHPDEWELAIVDLFLKQGSGLGVIQACASRKATQRVVVLSNYATPDIRKRCAQFGVDAVFDKSNEIDALIDFCIHKSGKDAKPAGAAPDIQQNGLQVRGR
ncbi:Response regulator receiver domain-containing protein [Burkholderiales bacterium 8X]|nr:Response regulator receiver domain-containing protein [Burkholderiales bacterium 8X]